MKKRYVVTGYGAFNSLGKTSRETFLNSLTTTRNTESITKWNPRENPAMTVYRANECSVDDILPEKEYRHWPSLTKAAFVAVEEAVKMSNLKSNRVATIISSIAGGNDSRDKLQNSFDAGKKKAIPHSALGISYDFTSSAISTFYKWNGPSTVMVAACASGIFSIDYGIKCIEAGDCDYAVVGGTDMMADKDNMYFFQVLTALSKRDQDFISQPFSNERDGLVMGEGAGVMVIESYDNAIKRGATIYAEISSIGFYTECEHITSPTDSGIGALECARIALERSKLETVDFISAHATSTILGDAVEYEAMNKLFPNAYISAAKGHLGHTMSASAILESIVSLECMQNGVIHPTANFTGCDFEKELKIVTAPTYIDINSILKNSYGFGGKCASIIYKKVN